MKLYYALYIAPGLIFTLLPITLLKMSLTAIFMSFAGLVLLLFM